MRKLFNYSLLLLGLITCSAYSQSPNPCFAPKTTFSTVQPAISGTTSNMSVLPDNRILLTYKTPSVNSCTDVAQLGVPDFNTNTISWGTPFTVNSVSGCAESVIVALSNTQGVILYKNDIPFQHDCFAKVINYPSSGNTISSVGSETEFTSTNPTDNGGRYLTLAKISTTKFLFTYIDFLFTGNPVNAQIGTVSGNNITFSAEVRATDPCCDSMNSQDMELKKLDTNKYIISYDRPAETNIRYARIIDTSGADPVFGTSNVLTGPRSRQAKIAVLDTNDFILTWHQDNVPSTQNLVAAVVCNVDVDGETITCNNPQIISISGATYNRPMAAFGLDSTTAIVAIGEGGGIGYGVFARLVNSNNNVVVTSYGLADSSYLVLDSVLASNGRFINLGFNPSAVASPYFANQFSVSCTANPPLPETTGATACPCNYGFTCINTKCYVKKVRYLSISPNPMNAGINIAIRVTHVASGRTWWVGDPGSGSYSALGASPVYLDWSLENDPIHIYGCGIAPSGSYNIQTIRQGDSISNPSLYSSSLNLSTAKWGDPVSVLFTSPTTMWGEPNNVVNATDIQAMQNSFNTPGAPNTIPISRSDMDSNQILNVTDIQRVIQAQGGQTYPFTPVASCP